MNGAGRKEDVNGQSQITTGKKSIKVRIFGSEYPLRGESEEFTRKVATYVDDMIGSIHAKLPEQPTLTVAVLSALNITEDLLREREKGKTTSELVEGELGKITSYLDNATREG
jgi:cell division protein ZapA (FtsZ GTPase activity inhibitor)